jgi:hypothetical protein
MTDKNKDQSTSFSKLFGRGKKKDATTPLNESLGTDDERIMKRRSLFTDFNISLFNVNQTPPTSKLTRKDSEKSNSALSPRGIKTMTSPRNYEESVNYFFKILKFKSQKMELFKGLLQNTL